MGTILAAPPVGVSTAVLALPVGELTEAAAGRRWRERGRRGQHAGRAVDVDVARGALRGGDAIAFEAGGADCCRVDARSGRLANSA